MPTASISTPVNHFRERVARAHFLFEFYCRSGAMIVGLIRLEAAKQIEPDL